MGIVAVAIAVVGSLTAGKGSVFAGDVARIVVREGTEWKPARTSVPVTIVPGSVLDLSDVLDEKLSPVSIRGGHFVDEDGRPIRFFSDAEVFFRRVHGFRGRKAEFDSPDRIDAFCKELKRRGFNMIRSHMLDGSLMLNSTTDFKPLDSEIDVFCRIVEALNRNGIYLNLDIAGTQTGWYAGGGWAKSYPPGQKFIGKRQIYWSEESRTAWCRGCEMLFDIRNPYTGRKLRDEPCMALAVAYNEQEFGFSRPGKGYEDCVQIYRDWLKRKYGEISKLNAVRGTSYAAFEDVPVFTPSDVKQSRIIRVGLDAYGFMDDAQVTLSKMYVECFRNACPRGFISNWNMAQDIRQMTLRKDFDFVSINGYHAHPFDPAHHSRRNGGVKVPDGALKSMEGWSCIGRSAKLARAFASCRIQGKPFVVTEYDIGWWNRFRYEMGFVMGGYAALQGWDGLTPFSENVAISTNGAQLATFEHWRDPVAQAENFLTALAFRRRDVSESGLKIRWTVKRSDILRSPHMTHSLSDAQSSFALVGSTALAVDEPAEDGTFSSRAVTGGEIIFRSEGFQTAAEDGRDAARGDFGSEIAARLRADGRLPSPNATDQEKGVYESSTGEILLDASRQFMRICTPRLQGICGKGGTTAKTADVSIRELSRDGNCFVAARDGMRPIRSARRLVVGYVTDAQNSGLTLADEEWCHVLDFGKLPVLYATGRFKVSVRNENAAKFRAWAVGPDGSRLSEIPLVHEDDLVTLAVDTATLSCGPTFFFELAEGDR